MSEEDDKSEEILDLSVEPTEVEGEDPLVGTKIDKYSIVARIARGGTAVVYRAHDEVLGREVAIKVLHEHLESRKEVVERFKHEARVVASLRHPNIVSVFDFLVFDKRSVLIVEYVPGQTLSDLIKRFRRIPEDFVLMIGLELLQGLRAAHEKGITHRDIKPANILLHSELGVKISDFGLAKLVHSDDGFTKDGIFVGTPSFSSPEQIEGKPVDHRSDLFSLGLTLYILATGKHAFKNKGDSTTTVWFKIVRGKFQAIRELDASISKDFERILDRCLQVDPNSRYPSAKAMIEDFVTILKKRRLYPYGDNLNSFLQSPYAADAPRISVFQRRKKLKALLASFFILACLVAGGWFVLNNKVNKEQPNPEFSQTQEEQGQQQEKGGSSLEEPKLAEPQRTPPKKADRPKKPRAESRSSSRLRLEDGMKSGPYISIPSSMKLIYLPQDSGFNLRFLWAQANDVFQLSSDPGFREVILEGRYQKATFDWQEWRSGNYYWRAGKKSGELSLKTLSDYRRDHTKPKISLKVSSEFSDVDLVLNPWTQSLELLWPTGPSANQYRIEIASNRSFSDILFSGLVPTKSANIERLWENSQEIYWRVSYLDESNNVFLVDPVRRINLKLKGDSSYFDLIEPRPFETQGNKIQIKAGAPAKMDVLCSSFDADQKAKLIRKDGFLTGSLDSPIKRLFCVARSAEEEIRILLPLSSN